MTSDKNPQAEALQHFGPLSVRRVIEAAIRIRQQVRWGEQVEVPFLTLYLTSGSTVSGWPLALGDNDGQSILVLHSSPDTQTVEYDATYVPVSWVGAVTVHRAPLHAVAYTDGTVKWPVGVNVPTAMVIQRRAEAIGVELSTTTRVVLKIVPEIGEDDVSRYAVAALLETVGGVLRRLATDATAHTALARLATVQLSVGASQDEAVVDGDRLIIRGVQGSQPRHYAWHETISSVL